MREGTATITAEVPLAETFGYATDLRSQTQGQGVFSMELACYRKVPSSVQEDVIAEKKQSELVAARGSTARASKMASQAWPPRALRAC